MTINQRIKLIRKNSELNQADFSKKLGLSQSGVSWIEQEGNNVSEQSIRLIASCFNIEEHWLLTGDGPMYKKDDDNIFNSLVDKYHLSNAQQRLFKTLFDMDDDKREILANIIFDFADAVQQTKLSTRSTSTQVADNELNENDELKRRKEIIEAEFLDEKKGIISSASTSINGRHGEKRA